MDLDREEEKYIRAKKRVEQLKGFYGHLAIYILVNALLITINLISSPDDLWFYFPLLGWGIGLLAHFMSVFVIGRFSEDWEDKKIKELMDKDRRK